MKSVLHDILDQTTEENVGRVMKTYIAQVKAFIMSYGTDTPGLSDEMVKNRMARIMEHRSVVWWRPQGRVFNMGFADIFSPHIARLNC